MSYFPNTRNCEMQFTDSICTYVHVLYIGICMPNEAHKVGAIIVVLFISLGHYRR